MNKVLLRDVTEQCFQSLESVGFIRYRKKWADLPLSDDFHIWVGLNESCDSSSVEINPFVGVHAVAIEKMWKELSGSPYRRSSATYSKHMGEIVPNEPIFHFDCGTDLVSETKRLANLYVSNGIPYAKSISSYEALLPLLKSRIDRLGAYPERFACCLYLLGEKEAAASFVSEFELKEPSYLREFAPSFRRFLTSRG